MSAESYNFPDNRVHLVRQPPFAIEVEKSG